MGKESRKRIMIPNLEFLRGADIYDEGRPEGLRYKSDVVNKRKKSFCAFFQMGTAHKGKIHVSFRTGRQIGHGI